MQQSEVINILKKDLNFTDQSIEKLKKFKDLVLNENKKYNLIAKSTENIIWDRHILDSAQLVKFIDFKSNILADLGSGAGFPGIVIEIFNKYKDFHVKLYEKSPVKREFLSQVIKKLELKAEVFGDVRDYRIDANIIVCRAFKKLEEVIQVSREIAKKPYKLMILKGQNAQEELKRSSKTKKYAYKLETSMTNKDSKIILMEIND
jgi:16S rRNA (guanine527-N7)-methyltransferase